MAQTTPTHYDVLGITRDADATEIRTAWKLHVQVWHPDRFDGELREQAEQRTARINEAYTALRDGSRRAAYDCRLAADERDAQRDRSDAPARSGSPRSPRSRPHAPAPSHPGGGAGSATAMHAPAPAPGISGLLDALATELVDATRRRPRSAIAIATACVATLVAGAAWQSVAGPSFPAQTVAASSPVARIEPIDAGVDLDAMAEQSRIEAARADAELARLMREDEAAARRAEAADAAAQARADRAAAAAARRDARTPSPSTGAGGVRPGGSAGSPDGRIVRIMPRPGSVAP